MYCVDDEFVDILSPLTVGAVYDNPAYVEQALLIGPFLIWGL